ncbi:hypothetical protein RVX_R18840 [Nitratidesulfovibrio sp. HK-II]|uniref:hypothetical protein n=1 Tax=Nitratidesulfovibrio sp. HK-II TaxID=2009266 RepID=UPI000ED64E0C|nr:hypothetical protein [Nitratidesulfovibrio sp. HK-II]GBO96216.1 hypothetical protein RVX_1256 [Nitratidesulfovibrio sp. HK-II]
MSPRPEFAASNIPTVRRASPRRSGIPRAALAVLLLAAALCAACAGRACPPRESCTKPVFERVQNKAVSAGQQAVVQGLLGVLAGTATGPKFTGERLRLEMYRAFDDAFKEEGYSLDATLREFLGKHVDTAYYRDALTSGLVPLLATPLSILRVADARQRLLAEGRVTQPTLDLVAAVPASATGEGTAKP